MITEAYLYGEDMLHEVTLFTKHVWQHMVPARDKFPVGGFELVMNVKVDPDTDNLVWRCVRRALRCSQSDAKRFQLLLHRPHPSHAFLDARLQPQCAYAHYRKARRILP